MPHQCSNYQDNDNTKPTKDGIKTQELCVVGYLLWSVILIHPHNAWIEPGKTSTLVVLQMWWDIVMCGQNGTVTEMRVYLLKWRSLATLSLTHSLTHLLTHSLTTIHSVNGGGSRAVDKSPTFLWIAIAANKYFSLTWLFPTYVTLCDLCDH